ncbi:MAG: caspase family protein [Anaerolineae bacterium]|nr:caspase family protein [Anaerolineae bacterium]
MSGKFALIIGNTEYIDPSLAQLTAPGKDAEDYVSRIHQSVLLVDMQFHIHSLLP